jgi:hypothetical protein
MESNELSEKEKGETKMTATTIVTTTTYKVLFIAEMFRVYRVNAGTSFGRSCKEIASFESLDEARAYQQSVQ